TRERHVEMPTRYPLERLRVPHAELQIGYPFARRPLARERQRSLAQIDPDHRPPGRDAVGRRDRGLPSPGREIEHVHPGPEPRELDHTRAERRAQPRLGAIVLLPELRGGHPISRRFEIVRSQIVFCYLGGSQCDWSTMPLMLSERDSVPAR